MYRYISWLAIVFVVVSCIPIVLSQDAEKCFMHRVDKDHPSPIYTVPDNETLQLRIYDHMVNDDSITKIFSGNSCILGIRNVTSEISVPEIHGCNKTVPRKLFYKNIFSFRKTDHDLKVDVDFDRRNITGNVDTVRVETDDRVSVGVSFNCQDECLEFENISISPFEPYLFVRKIEDLSNVDCSVIAMDGLERSDHVSRIWNQIGPHLRTDCWYNINIELTYSEVETNGLRLSEVYGYFQSYPEAPIYLGSVKDSYFTSLDFIRCRGLRFSLCGDSLPKCDINKAQDLKDCHVLENLVISSDTSSILVKKVADDNEVECPVTVETNHGDRKSFPESGVWREISQFLSANCWYQINFTTNYSYVKENHYAFEVYGHFQTSPEEPRLLGSIDTNASSLNVHLNLANCKGLRFSNCTIIGSDSIPMCFYINGDSTDFSSMLYLSTALPILAILLIIIITVTYKQRLLGMCTMNAGEADATRHIYDEIANPIFNDNGEPMTTEREEHIYESVSDFFINEGERDEHIYESTSDFFINEGADHIYEEIDDLSGNDDSHIYAAIADLFKIDN